MTVIVERFCGPTLDSEGNRRMRVLIADKLPEFVVTRLSEVGADVALEPALKDDSLLDRMRALEPHILLVRSTKVTADHINASQSLQLIVRAGAGVNTIDLDAASERAVSVANCPGMNAIEVAELTFGHIINADRRIADNVMDLRDGEWRKKHYAKAKGLKARTIGDIGCGAIARAVIRRAQAFEMKVACFAPELDQELSEELNVLRCESVVDVAKISSIISVHVPTTPATTHLIDEVVLDALPDGAIVINTSRGGIIDEAALRAAVSAKSLRAGLDVFENEPAADGAWSCPLAELDGVYGTHHIGASTDQAQRAVAEAACQTVEDWLTNGEAQNCVNLAATSSAKHRLVVRHLDQVGVFASMLEILRDADLNVKKMRNQIYSGSRGAACARIHVQGTLTEVVITRIRKLNAVIDVQVTAL